MCNAYVLSVSEPEVQLMAQALDNLQGIYAASPSGYDVDGTVAAALGEAQALLLNVTALPGLAKHQLIDDPAQTLNRMASSALSDPTLQGQTARALHQWLLALAHNLNLILKRGRVFYRCQAAARDAARGAAARGMGILQARAHLHRSAKPQTLAQAQAAAQLDRIDRHAAAQTHRMWASDLRAEEARDAHRRRIEQQMQAKPHRRAA